MKTRDERHHHVADRTAGPPGPAPTPRRDATDESLLLDDFFPSEEEEEEEDKNASNHRFTTTEESDANGEGSPRAGKL